MATGPDDNTGSGSVSGTGADCSVFDGGCDDGETWALVSCALAACEDPVADCFGAFGGSYIPGQPLRAENAAKTFLQAHVCAHVHVRTEAAAAGD